MSDIATKLAHLKAQRDALNEEIYLIESGIKKAAYDANLANQLATTNDARWAEGKPTLTMSAWLQGQAEDEE